jgi:uncharacterized protein YukE
MRAMPAGLDAGAIAALANQLSSYAERCTGTAADLTALRGRVANWWVGDAADQYKIHVEWKEKALGALASATTQAAAAASAYADAIRAAVAQYEEAAAGVRLAESYGNIPAAWKWDLRGTEVVEQLEEAAHAFAESLNDRFTPDTGYWPPSWDYDDLDALAAERDKWQDYHDHLLEKRSAWLRGTGLVDGVPDRIPPPPPDPNSIPNATDQLGGAAGITLGPSSQFKVGLRGGSTATIKRYDNGVVEVEYDLRGGGTITGGDYDGEMSKAAVYRYVFPDPATAQSFFDRLAVLQSQRPNAVEAAQFDEQFRRYRTAEGGSTIVKVGSDGPHVDREGAISYGTETDTRSGDRTSVTKFEAKTRGTSMGAGAGLEVDAEIRQTTTAANEPKQFEVTFSGHNKQGVVIETDILKQVGADQNPRVQRGLDLVKGQYEQFDGQYGRVNVKVDLSTPEGRELAQRLRDDAEQGRLPSRATIERAQRLGQVKVESGTFTERNGKFELEPTPRSPGVLLEGTNRSYDPHYRTPPN